VQAQVSSLARTIVVVSDYQAGDFVDEAVPSFNYYKRLWIDQQRSPSRAPFLSRDDLIVEGGYIERLPLACVKAGIVDRAEVWSHCRGAHPPSHALAENACLTRRSFRLNGPEAPFASNDMLAYIATMGPPEILCIWGLGVCEEIMLACSKSYKIYNSIDAPALRVPADVSRHFDLVLTGAEWQSQEVNHVHPEIPAFVLPIGPEFASETMFRPMGLTKQYDVIYVAAAQPYKRHDVLFHALAKMPKSLKALCVCGYGEMIEDLRVQVANLGLDVDFIGPPGVAYEDVNRLMSLSKVGVVCGVDDGAPAILTEYMLAGIPVLANSALACGLQYILPGTGRSADASNFHEELRDMLGNLEQFSPREVALERWTWQHSVEKLKAQIMATTKGNLIWGSKEPSQ
jgi:glycosyltransferase involved in cell wall biosynthesis